jgi:hypothetical protein
MRTYRRFFIVSAALTLIGLGGTILGQGGWQAAAAGLGMLAGIGFVLSVAALAAAGERPRLRYPDWGQAGAKPRRMRPETGLRRPPEAVSDARPARASRPRRHAPGAVRPRSVPAGGVRAG